MKFLVSATPLQNPPPAPPDPERWQKAQAMLDAWKAKGQWLCGYLTVDGGGFGVMEATSAEELFAGVRGWPFYAFNAWRIEPVVSMEDWVKSQIKKATG